MLQLIKVQHCIWYLQYNLDNQRVFLMH